MDLIDMLKEQIKTEKKSIVFPEGTDKRILSAAAKLKKENILNPILVGKEEDVKKNCSG